MLTENNQNKRNTKAIKNIHKQSSAAWRHFRSKQNLFKNILLTLSCKVNTLISTVEERLIATWFFGNIYYIYL